MTASSYTTYHTIDDALKQYYARRGYLHYCDNKDSGLFSNYIIEQKLDEKLTIEELNNAYDPNKYSYLWLYFDINFPIPRCATTLTHDQQQTLKFYIVQYCYKFHKSPSDEYITRVLLPKCNISRSAVIVVNSGKFDKHRTEQESIQGVCVDEIVDEVLQEYAPTNNYLYGISDMEIKLNLFVNKWNNNHNKKRKLKLEQLKIVLVTIHTSCRLDFIHLLNNFNISACAAMQLWIIVNDILNDNSITYASSDENWPPSLCSGINQHDISDDDDDDGDDSGINEDDIYDEAGDNTQYIHNKKTTCESNRIIPYIQYDKWDVNFSSAGDLYYNRCLLPLQMQQLRIQMNDDKLKLDIIIIKQIFDQVFKLYVLCMVLIYKPFIYTVSLLYLSQRCTKNIASIPSVICNEYVNPLKDVISTGDIIKKEILSVIDEHEFERTKRKVKRLYNCYRFHKYKTKVEGTFGTETWKKGDEITFEELLYLKMFNDHDKLKQKCNHLWYFNYKLLTIISKFGEHKFGINQNNDNMQLYLTPNSHNMVMARNTSLFVPLSTFGCNEMAEILIEEGETIMKIQPVFSNSCYCRALDASKISDHPDEEEYIIMYIYSNIIDISTWNISVSENKFE